MKQFLLLILIIGIGAFQIKAQTDISNEELGIDNSKPTVSVLASTKSAGASSKGIPSGGYLLIGDSSNDRVMAFDPTTGDLVDENFIPTNANLSTPIEVALSSDQTSLLVSDQLADAVIEFDLDGNFVGIFAPLPGDPILNNLRGLEIHPVTGNVLVTSGDGMVHELNTDGSYAGEFIPSGTGGMTDPFDIVYRPNQNDFLVTGIDNDAVYQYDIDGTFISEIVPGPAVNFGEQVSVASTVDNFLVANFSSPSGAREYQSDGTFVGYYDLYSGLRGIHELPNANLLITSGAGVFEITRSNTLVEAKYTATTGPRFISFINPPSTVNVTFRVDMQNQTVPPEGVHIAGSFPAPYPFWSPNGIMLNPPPLGSVYTVTLAIEPGTYLEYKFINGDEWGEDESVPGNCAANGNRFLTVPDNDTILPIKCYASCLPCVLPPVDVTFQVDMSNEVVSPNGVHVAGSFNSWTPDATPMTDAGNGVYEVTLTLGEGEYHEFKYLNGNNWGTDESVPPSCANNNNRYLTVPSANTTLPLVCFGSCDPCTSVTDINVTFQVDMSEQTVAAEGVHIAGSFQGWDPAGTLMNDLGNGIWEYSIVLQSGDYHEYKFINGDAWGEDELVPGACAQNNNRFITVPDSDIILPAVCYGECIPCNPPLYDITFNVDMSNQIVSPLGVHLAGSFQGWDPSATPMTDMGNGIYSITLALEEGALHEYKFVNGNDWPFAENVPGECANFGGNREFFGPSANTILDTVCFGECGPCVTTLYTFDLKVMLEGAFNGTTMDTYMFDNGMLPVDQPYDGAPWNYPGTETLSAPSGSGVVDWVYIQMRETDGDASTATIDKMIDHQAAVILSDGSVARPDGTPGILYTGNITQDLYIVIYHRNHIAVMSATPLVESSGTFSYDFTDALSKAYMDGQKALGGGMYGMISGDSDGSGTVDSDDKDINWTGSAGNAGYHGSDLNLDSQVNNPDKDDFWLPNLGAGTMVP